MELYIKKHLLEVSDKNLKDKDLQQKTQEWKKHKTGVVVKGVLLQEIKRERNKGGM